MSVVSVNLLFTGKSATEDLQYRRTYRETWEVICSSLSDDEQVVANATGVPKRGQSHRRDPLAVVKDREISQSEDSPYIWYVSLTYDTQLDLPQATNPDGETLSPQELAENPLLRPAVWKISGQKTSEVCAEWLPLDAAGNLGKTFKAIVNSALLPFDPPAMCEVSRPLLRVTKNVKEVSLEYLLRLQDAVNDRVWRNLPKWTARVDSYEANNKTENGVSFVELTLDIALRAETWLLQILDAGLLERIETANPKPPFNKIKIWTPIKDPFGHFGTVQPLNGSGQRLAPGADPVFLKGLPRNYHLDNFDSLLPF
jgi:hypothetical protein